MHPLFVSCLFARARWAALLIPLTLALAFPAHARSTGRSGTSFSGANPLNVSRAEFASAQDGMELIYQRRYSESLEVFEEAGIDFPDSPLGPVGRALVYQARMFENYSFTLEREYLSEYAEAEVKIKRALRKSHGKRRAWIYFLQAVHLGLHATYDIRHNKYLSAFDKGWDALELIKKIERIAPEFHDAQLGLGLYNYWRTVITERVDILPKFGDHREEGLRQMRIAKEKGYLAKAPSCFILTYSYLEQKNYSAAIAEVEWGRKRYPDNLLMELFAGQVYVSAKKFPEARAALDRVRQIDPTNTRVWFHFGEMHYKSKRNNRAATESYLRYLESNPPPEYRAFAYYRIGMIERRARKWDEAIRWLEKAVQTWPKLKQAVKRLEETRAARTGKTSRSSPRGRRWSWAS